ncbi:MAG TPA: PQQ-binding-like beta-propeller repeat protein [Planctomycetota bacterium]|nr:PQQ-binding-like beta-propeller repeat protein [Planctomycetota bacterium]
MISDLPGNLAVIPVLVGPLQTLIALLPALAAAFGAVLVALFKPGTAVKLAKLLWVQKVPVTCAAALVWLLIWGIPKLWPRTGKTVALGGTNSLLFRGGPDRRGWIGSDPSADDPTSGGRIWAQRDVAQTFYSSPAVTGDHVFIASVYLSPYTDRGSILCLDAKTGEVNWQDSCGDLRATYSSPAVSDDCVVCGEGTHETDNARIVCLDRRNGKKLWTQRVMNHHGVEATPCIANGKVYAGGGYDGIYCLNLKPDEKGEPVVLWHKDGNEYPDTESSPVVVDGNLYFGLGITGNALCCLDAESGDEKWRIATPYPVFTAPCIAGGKIFIGMGNGNLIKSATELGLPEIGEVWCIDLATHTKPDWTFKTGKTVLGGCAAGKDCVYFGSQDGFFYRVPFDCDPTKVKKWNAQAPISSSPALARDTVYFVSTKGMLYGLDANDLKPKWEACLWTQPPADKDYFLSSPTVANGHVYVGTAKDGLLCVGVPGKRPDPVWEGYLGGPGKSGRADNVPLAAHMENREAWAYPKDAAARKFQITSPLAYLNGDVHAGIKEGDTFGLAKFELNKDPAQLPTHALLAKTKNAIVLSPAVKDSVVYFVDGKRGDTGRALYCVNGNLEHGSQIALSPVEGMATGDFTLIGDQLVIANRIHGISAPLLNTKENAWTYSCGESAGPPCGSEGRIAAAFKNPNKLVLLDSATGGELWSVALDSAPTTGPIMVEQAICLGTEHGVIAYQLLDGKPIWCQESVKVATPLIAAEGKLACVGTNKTLALLDATDGKVVKSFPGLANDLPPLLTRDGLCFAVEQGFKLAPLNSAKQPDTWFRTRGFKQETPLLVVNSYVYFGSDKGLMCFKPKVGE